MPSAIDQRENIQTALRGFINRPLPEAARELFEELGYKSARRLPIESTAQFRKQLDPGGKLTEREGEALSQLTALHLLFQLSNAELDNQGDLLDDPTAVQSTKIESYIFFAAELPPGHYTRTALASLVRAVNKPLPMPALVLFRHGETISIGIIHRRLHKREQSRDVLEKVTLIKEIALDDPIRAHIEILNDLVLSNLDSEFGVSNFVRLHEAWQKRLNSYALSDNFYREIADWYFWAHHQVEDGIIRLPLHCDTEQEKSLFLIRLLTRVIFCWFLVEKRLIPADLFREHRLKSLLEDYVPTKTQQKPDSSPIYYRAVLQNLFFGTLNMPIELRAFREKKKSGERYDQNYGITNLWRYETSFRNPEDWIDLAKRIPFLNGGLFDCLDDKTGKKKDNFILDGFSDREDFGCHLPNDLFFGRERTVDLSRDYGEQDKRTARSKKAKVRGLIEILSRYKFTVEENTPLEEEIALDPELLGKVFENLLASYNEDTRTTARKALGAFYTPREIVSYMVDEALKSYLAAQVPRCKGALEDLFSNKATLKEIKPDTRDALVAAIGRVKILDPACGSGAFPMGALHRLVDLLQKLDPNNESWKRDRLAEARRYYELLAESGASKDEIAACDIRIADIEKSFDTRFHALDFARKLYLIENSIYGVDIQPIATQISKLRFFISLVVDQKMAPKAYNLGVRPLPNLETRIVAANTLIPIEKSESDLFSGEIDMLRGELASIRHEHFNARTPTDKRKWRDADAAKRQEIASLLEREHAIPRDSARKLAAWDPYDQNEYARFFDSEWMFGLPVGRVRVQAARRGAIAIISKTIDKPESNSNGKKEINSGFDIVIGNPPYQGFRDMPQALKDALRPLYVTANGKYDLYVPFIEKGLSLLSPDSGILSYICPMGFAKRDYGESIRMFLAKKYRVREVVDFEHDQVFAAAMNYTGILLVEQNPSKTPYSFKYRKGFGDTGTVAESSRLIAGPWVFSSSTDQLITDRMASSPTLGEIARITEGIVTGLNDIYLKKNEEIEELHLEREYFKCCLRGRMIDRYFIRNTGEFVFYPYEAINGKTVPIEESELRKNAPATYRYIKRNLDRINSRDYFTNSSKQWFELWNQRDLKLLSSPKIVTPELSERNRFTFASHEMFFGDTVCGIALKKADDQRSTWTKSLLGILNSVPVEWHYKKTTVPKANGFFIYKVMFLKSIPIPDMSYQQANTVARLVDYLLILNNTFNAKQSDQSPRDPLMLAYWERIINGLVYELYFPDEVHGADLQIFDCVEKAQLPDINVDNEPKHLRSLRTIFENLYDNDHPLRIALDKLQTLDVARTIEGKT